MTSPQSTEALKPCPFCGGSNIAFVAGDQCGYTTCDDCLADGPTADTEADAIALWNTRALSEPTCPSDAGEGWRLVIRQEVINSPETADFMAGVPLEAAHQRDRWGVDHDAGKTPFDWFWLVGYLAQKAASSAVAGDTEKAKHHTISTAAALANWHAALTGATTAMRPGIRPTNGGEKAGSANALAEALA